MFCFGGGNIYACIVSGSESVDVQQISLVAVGKIHVNIKSDW